jgi:nicotinate-nucleotide adenylyltransferase
MDIGLFGGSFNPPHIAHLIVAETVRDQFGLEQIWWIPSHNPPHKHDSELATAEHRLEMTRRATAENPAFTVSDIEIQREGVSYTVDTLRTLQQEHPEASFWLIIGSDSMRDFDQWHCPDEIVDRVPLIVYKRPGAISSIANPRYSNHVRFADAPLLEVSGTEVRARCRRKRSIRYLVPDAVRDYIRAQNLYAQAEAPAQQ